MPRYRSLVLALACSLPFSFSAAAQDTPLRRFTVGAGFSFQDDDRVTPMGVHLEGAYVVPLVGRRLEGRLEAGLVRFSGSRGFACAPGTVCTGGSRMTVLNAGVSVVFVEQSDRRGAFYWIAGLGVYPVTAAPGTGPYSRVGWNVGGGMQLGSGFIELRYHQLMGGDRFRHLVPITFGVRF